jgi:hypothetical protein
LQAALNLEVTPGLLTTLCLVMRHLIRLIFFKRVEIPLSIFPLKEQLISGQAVWMFRKGSRLSRG